MEEPETEPLTQNGLNQRLGKKAVQDCIIIDLVNNEIPEHERKETLKTRFENFGEDTDVHGLKYILREDSPTYKKVIWMMLLVISLGYMTFEIYGRFSWYFTYPHVTKVDVVFRNNMEFPAFTICNMNKFRASAMTDVDILNMGKILGIVNDNMKLHHGDHYNETFVNWVNSMNWTRVREKNKTFHLEEFSRRVGHQAKDMIVYCRWKDELCGPDNFTHSFTHLGNCYTFNDNQKFAARKAGAGNGLKLYLDIEEFDYLETADAADDGLKVIVHSQKEPPFIRELGFGLMPAQHHYIGIRKAEIINLPKPYGTCAEDFPMRMFEHYTIPGCRIQCETEHVVQACGCRLPEMPVSSDAPICSPLQYDDCALAELIRVSESDDCVCQSPCHLDDFRLTHSSVKLRPETIEKLQTLHAHVPKHLKAHNIVVMDVFFEALSLELIEQKVAYPWPSLLGDIGGQMGLFIGASVLTILHAVEFFTDEIAKSCKKKADKTDQVNPDETRASMGPNESAVVVKEAVI